jgi:cofilin
LHHVITRTQEDFDQVKKAFLRAQQIKAGLDAGLIRDEDYIQARNSFLHALDFNTSGGNSSTGLP